MQSTDQTADTGCPRGESQPVLKLTFDRVTHKQGSVRAQDIDCSSGPAG